jgi:HAD superfamily hydrolase (TIGR01450 family)
MTGKRDDDAGPARRRLAELLPAYDGLLLDAYGVLNDASGALPGASALLAALDRRGLPFWVVTNDASRLPATLERRFADLGLAIDRSRIVTTGGLLAGWFERGGLIGARTVVLGPPDSRAYVEQAGGIVVPLAPDASFEVLVVADEASYDFLAALDAALSAIARLIDAGRPPRLCLPNPDLIYPAGPARYGFTAGAAAMLLEAALERRFGARFAFDRLGKPGTPLFEEAVRRAGSARLLMVGDQLETDIAGARAAGLDAALLETGISSWRGPRPGLVAPTYLVSALWDESPTVTDS